MNDRPRRVLLVDAFTQDLFTGNPAGVVPNAEGLSRWQMQAIARELRASETAFVLPADAPDHDIRLRFFTPTTEVPSCGHATLAAHHVLAMEGLEDRAVVVQKIEAGLQRIYLEPEQDGLWIATVHEGIEIEATLSEPVAAEVLAALGVVPEARDPRCPIQIVSTGHSKVMVGIRSAEELDGIRPDFARLVGLSQRLGSNGFFAFAMTDGIGPVLTECRMFAPAIGIPEDPVTGNGHGPLGAYLVEHGLLRATGRTAVFESRQGRAMGRPGRVRVQVEIEDGRALEVWVRGQAVTVLRGELEI